MRLSPSVVLLRTQSDERLTALARDGSEPAFTALVERYRRVVLRTCGGVLSESRAEDATQQTFLAAWNALRRGDDVRDVRPWLLRIARNTALNALRNPGYEYMELAESLQGGAAPQAELERREVMRQTLAGLAALPDNQREALLRSAVEGAPHADIARDLGISEGATRQLVLRARATLRAGATALTPLSFVNWAAAGGGTVGSAFVAKAALVAVVSGTAVATPVVVTRGGKDEPAAARVAERSRSAERERAAATATPAPAPATETASTRALSRQTASQNGRDDDRPLSSSGPGPGGEPEDDGDSGDDSEGSDSDNSGPSSDSGSSGSGESGSGGSDNSGPGSDNSGSGHSGSGGGDDGASDDGDAAATPVPTVVVVVPTVTPQGDDNSGPGGGGGGDNSSSGHGSGDDG